jgi:predicted nuclease with TOPRIM domain
MADIREQFDDICKLLETEINRLKWKEDEVNKARERILQLKIEKAIVAREISSQLKSQETE